MNRRLLPVLAVAGLLAALVLGWMRFSAPAPPLGNLAGSSLGGAFALIDQDGRVVTDQAFAGRYRLMYFGYTSCPDVCPTDMGLIARGVADFAKKSPSLAARVAPIFVTVDPERDDIASIKAFVRAFGPDITGLTGNVPAIAAARKAYGIYARKVPTSDPQNYLVDHFAVIYLFGPDGAPIAFLPHGSSAGEVTAMLETYVR